MPETVAWGSAVAGAFPHPTGAGRPPRLRVLHVIGVGTTGGGAERLVAELVAAQRAVGHEVRVLSSDLPANGVRFSDVCWPQRIPTGLIGRLIGQLRNPAARAALAELVERWCPHVVHLHTVGLLAPFTLSVLAATPTVLTVHGPELFVRSSTHGCMAERYFRPAKGDTGMRLTWRGRIVLAGLKHLVGQVWLRQLRVVDVYLAPSRYIASLVEPDCGPARVVPNGLACARAAPPPTPAPPPTREGAGAPGPGCGPRPRRVVFVGRLEHLKGPQVLVEAAPALLARHPDVRFTICGAGPLGEALRQRVSELDLTGTVDLAGWLKPDDVARQLAEADVVVVPSVWPEAFGLTCLEALAAGTPVVASAIGALPDLVQPDVTGLLVPPLNPAALASAVSRLLADEPLRRRLGAQGRRLSERYTIDAHRQAVEDAYDEAIRRRRTGSSAADRGDGARPTAGRIRRIVDESLLRNSASLLLATIAIAGGGFVFWQLVTHLFDLADVGLAGAMISLSILLSNLALLGMPNSMIRYLAEWPDPARTVNGGALLVAVAALGAAWCFATVATLFAPRLAQALGPPRAAAFCVFTTASALCMLYDNVFIALRRSGQVLRRNLLVVALRLTLPVFLVGMHAFGVFTAYWLAFTVASVPYPFVLRRIFGRCPRQPPASVTRVRRMARYSLGTHAASVVLTAPALLMPGLVAQRVGLRAAAYFSIAALLAGVLLFVPQATTRSLFAEAAHDPRHSRRHLTRVLTLTAGAQLPLLLVLTALGGPLLRLFGDEYRHAYPLYVVLCVANALGSVGYVGSTLLLISGEVRRLCLLSVAACTVSVVGGYVLATGGLIWIGAALLAGEMVLAIGYAGTIRGALRTAGEPSRARVR